MIAGRQIRHAGADLRDDAGAFVSNDGRQDARAQTFNGGQVGMAESCRPDLDQHLAGARAIEIEGLDFQRLAFGVGPRKSLLIQDGAFYFHR